jgi:hypothetical protein
MKKRSKQALSQGTMLRAFYVRCDANPAAVLRPRDSVCHRAGTGRGRSLHRRLCGHENSPLRCPTVKEREKTPALLHRQQPPTVSAATISSPVHRAGESGIEVTRMHATFRSARGSKCAMGNCTPYADLLFRAVSRSAPTRFTCRRPIWLCWIWQESWQPLGPVPVSAGPAEVSFAFADENVHTRAAASYSSLVLY